MKQIRPKTGFTLVEILMVLAIMTILIAIGGYQVDLSKKRSLFLGVKEDTENVANVLNDMYHTGNYGQNKKWDRKGSYPSYKELNLMDSSLTDSLSDLILKAAGVNSHAGGAIGRGIITIGDNPTPSDLGSLVDDSENGIHKQNIGYHPITSDGSLCQDSSQECRRVKLFYNAFVKHNQYDLRVIELDSGAVVKSD